MGLLIVGAGVVIALIGLAAMAGLLGWVGRLPGDLRYSNGNVRVYAPLATMLVVSLVLSLVLALFRR